MISKLEEMEEKNPKEYWNIIKELREKKVENRVSNPEEFEQFFKRLFSIQEDVERNPKHEEIEKKVASILQNPSIMMEEDYTFKELTTAVDKLKNGKASLLVPAEMLKASPKYILMTLLKICNKIKNQCHFPQLWAKGITSLLLKDGDEEDPNNYRAITVADALSKVMTIMMNERLVTKLEDEKTINHHQIAFKKKARPADHLFVIKSIFDNYTSHGKKVFTCFVDFQKAYDNVWRMGLYYKLIKYGVNVNTVKLIKDMYCMTRQVTY